MYSNKALIKLIENNVMFDYIFIDAAHDAKNVLNDAILSWQILKPCGVIIFDDYEWDKIKQEFYRPKIAIDSFISVFKPELKILFKRYQVGVEKLCYNKIEKPVQEEYYFIMDKINKNVFKEIKIELDFKIKKEKLKIEIKYSDKEIKVPELDKYIKEHIELKNISKEYSNKNSLEKIDFANLADTLKKNYVYSAILKRFNIVDTTINSFIDIYPIKNIIEKGKNSCFILNRLNITKKLIIFLKRFNKNLTVDYYKNDIPELIQLEDYLKILNKKKKYSILYLTQGNKFGSLTAHVTKHNINCNLLMNLILCLNMQKEGGNACIRTNFYFDKFFYELIYVLKMYYKKVVIKNMLNFKMATSIIIECYDFTGIDNKELENYNSIIKKIENKELFTKNNKVITGFLDTDKYKIIEKNMTKFKKEILDKIVLDIETYILRKKYIIDEKNDLSFKKMIIRNVFKNTIITLNNILQ